MEKESDRIGLEDRDSSIISVDHEKKMTAIQWFYPQPWYNLPIRVKGKYLHKFKNSEYTPPAHQSEENIWRRIPAKWTEQKLLLTEDEEGRWVVSSEPCHGYSVISMGNSRLTGNVSNITTK